MQSPSIMAIPKPARRVEIASLMSARTKGVYPDINDRVQDTK